MIICGLLFLSLAVTVIISLTVLPDLWWCIPVFIGIFIGLNILYLLGIVLFSLFMPKEEGAPDNGVCRKLVTLTMGYVLFWMGISVKTEGLDKITDDTPFLLVGNHLYFSDPFVTATVLYRRKLSFVSKPENLALPIVGNMAKGCSYLSIDRDNPRNAVTTIKKAAEFISERHISMGIYPEGTRSKTGELLPFRDGAFKIATMAKCPIVICTVQYEKGILHRKTAHLHIVEVLGADYVCANRTNAISEKVRNIISEDLKKGAD